MSNRLDIVRLIDSKVTATRRTVARSKQLAEAAKADLTTHEEWLEHHRQHARQDLEQHQRRLSRRRRVEACKRSALWLLLLVPSACVAVFRAAGAGLAALGEAFYFGWYWIGTTAYALGRWLIRLVAGSITCSATTLFTLTLWVAAGFWLILSWLGAGTGQIAVSAFGAGSRGLTWLGPRSRSLGHWLAQALSFGFSRLAVLTVSLGGWLIGAIEGQIEALATRWRQDATPPAARREPSLDPRRLQAAAFVRLRAEHDRLQARIHAMDQNYGSRVPAPGRPDGGEWAQLRELGRNARRLFEIQEAEMLGPAGSRGAGRSRAQQPNGTTLAASVHPPRAGHAPARAPGRRQRRP